MAIKHRSTRAKRPLLLGLGSAEPITIVENIPHPATLEGVLALRRDKMLAVDPATRADSGPMNWYHKPLGWVFLRGRSGYPTPDITITQALIGPHGEIGWDNSEIATQQGIAEHYALWLETRNSPMHRGHYHRDEFTYGQRKKAFY